MKIAVGTQVWVVIDNDGNVKGVWNNLRCAEEQAERLGLNTETNIQVSQYLGGI